MYTNNNIMKKTISEQNLKIELCPFGTYLDEDGSVVCEKCVENGACKGGYIPTYPEK